MRIHHSRRGFLRYMMGAALGAALSRSTKTFAEDPVQDKYHYLPMVSAPPKYTNLIFLHHSTGDNLIHQGNVRPLFTTLGYSFWDHDYNSPGLSLPSGEYANYDYSVPDDNTNPDGFNNIFQQAFSTTPPHPERPANCFSGLMRHDVIIFKSCFPASHVYNDDTLEEYKTYYRAIRARADLYRNKIFIPFSTPPLKACDTNANEARLARAFANWLKSSEYLSGHPNLFPFDFFDLLAQPEGTTGANMLRPDYCPDGCDSHPNQRANQAIGPIFVNHVDTSIKAYKST